MGVKKVARFLTPPLARQPHDVNQHLRGRRSRSSRHRLRAPSRNRGTGHRCRSESERGAACPPARIAGETKSFPVRPVLVLQHDAGGVVGDDPADDVRRHDDAKRQRIVLNDEGNVRPDRFDRLRVVGDDLIVRAIMRSTLAASMLPSTRNGMGAIGKTPLRPNKNNEFAVLKPEQDAVNHLETAQRSCAHWKLRPKP